MAKNRCLSSLLLLSITACDDWQAVIVLFDPASGASATISTILASEPGPKSRLLFSVGVPFIPRALCAVNTLTEGDMTMKHLLCEHLPDTVAKVPQWSGAQSTVTFMTAPTMIELQAFNRPADLRAQEITAGHTYKGVGSAVSLASATIKGERSEPVSLAIASVVLASAAKHTENNVGAERSEAQPGSERPMANAVSHPSAGEAEQKTAKLAKQTKCAVEDEGGILMEGKAKHGDKIRITKAHPYRDFRTGDELTVVNPNPSYNGVRATDGHYVHNVPRDHYVVVYDPQKASQVL